MNRKDIFDAVDLHGLPLKNRLVRSATWEALADEQGHMPETLYNVYDGLAKGGVGCIITGFTSVADSDHDFEGKVRLSNDTLVPEHQRLTELSHAQDCPIIVQLALGEYNARGVRDMAIDNMTGEDVECVKELFIAAAGRAAKAGYDGVQIHGAHGFFLSRFISPFYNHRKDAYGGSAEDRGRILAEIISGVKAIHPQLHVSLKINSSDQFRGGLTPAESMTICKLCARSGYDSIEVSGNGTSATGIRPGVNEAYFKDFALALAEEIDIPVILVGGHRSAHHMNAVLNDGNIAALSLSRPLVREPDLPNRWANGNTAPAKCVSCNMCYRTPGHICVFALKAKYTTEE